MFKLCETAVEYLIASNELLHIAQPEAIIRTTLFQSSAPTCLVSKAEYPTDFPLDFPGQKPRKNYTIHSLPGPEPSSQYMEPTKGVNGVNSGGTCPNATHVHQELSRDGPVIAHGNPWMGIVRPLTDWDKRGIFV